METYQRTERTQVRRVPQRGSHEAALIHAILDDGFVCHVGFVVDGQPFVIPTGYGRDGSTIYLHGSPASRMVRSLSAGLPVCVTVTHIDGLVLAKSAFHHSMNYRSVVVVGTAMPVLDPEAKLRALECMTNHIVPGRWDIVRQPNEKELKATLVLALPIEEASAKVRTGPPLDDEEDLDFPVWAGVIAISQMRSEGVGG